MELNKQDIEFLIDCLKNGKEIPEVYKYAIFPTKQKEYELVYAGKMRKEDILADTEEAKPVPLQIEKIFNGKKYPPHSRDWQNLLVFGDNLQILKTFYEDKDPLIKGKVKGRVKLIYIDPPFATTNEFSSGAMRSYIDDRRAAEFVEYLRRRLVLARELLSEDGSIYVHLDRKKSHYIKLVLDEIFGENNLKNEIIWHYHDKFATGGKSFDRNHDTIFHYSKNAEFIGNEIRIAKEETTRRALRKKVGGKTINVLDENGNKIYEEYTDKRVDDVWDIGRTISKNEYLGYPTQKKEALLDRVLRYGSNYGDLVMDFFAGSGTTLAVAEKLGRRWIGCDIGKLAIYTTQKRLLEIESSKNLIGPKPEYGKAAKSFAVVTSGLYDLGKVFDLQKDDYIRFVKNLFELEETKTTSVGGVEIDGKKRGFYTKIFPYWKLINASVDEKYLQELHNHIGEKIDGRFYIIAPANNVNFISDYHQIGSVRYYFLKVPYQIIKELHKVQFKKFRQPQSKRNINDLDEAIGFHFIRQPEVKSQIKLTKKNLVLKISKFESAHSQDETGEKLSNFESLAMLLVDLNYDGEKFMMTNYYFADDLISHSQGADRENTEEIKKELKKQTEIKKEFLLSDCGKAIMAIYIDIYGNEFREVFKVK